MRKSVCSRVSSAKLVCAKAGAEKTIDRNKAARKRIMVEQLVCGAVIKSSEAVAERKAKPGTACLRRVLPEVSRPLAEVHPS